MTPTFFPGPAPFSFKGEKTVRPAQNIEAACRDSMASGMGKTNCWCARIAVENPPWVTVPSGYSAFYKRFEFVNADKGTAIFTYIGINLLRAVILISIFALPTLQASSDLGTNTNTITSFESLHVITNANDFADYLVPYHQGKLAFSPALMSCVHI